jgi:hypothetical protein
MNYFVNTYFRFFENNNSGETIQFQNQANRKRFTQVPFHNLNHRFKAGQINRKTGSPEQGSLRWKPAPIDFDPRLPPGRALLLPPQPRLGTALCWHSFYF